MTIKELYEEAKKQGKENCELLFCDGYGLCEIQEVNYDSYQNDVVLFSDDD